METNPKNIPPGQQPPHPPQDLEKHLLSACLLDEKYLTRALDVGLSDGDFFTPGYKVLFRRMQERYRAGDPVTFTDFYSSLTESEIAGIGGTAGLAELAQPDAIISVSTMFDTNVSRLMSWRKSRRAWEAAREMQAGIEAGQNLDEAMRQVRELVEDEADDAGGYISGKDAFALAVHYLEAAVKAGGLAGVSSGFPSLDALTSGLQPGWYYVLGARTGVGKTAFAENIALNVARGGGRVLFVTAEMTPAELVQRAFSIAGQVSFAKWFTPEAMPSKEEMHNAAEAAKRVKRIIDGAGMDFVDVAGRSVEAVADAIRAAHRREPLALVIVDYLQLLHSDTQRAQATEVDNLAAVSRSLRDLAKALGVPVLAVAQLNRDCTKNNRAPVVSDLKGSGQIEQDANVILLLHREEVGMSPEATDDEQEGVRGVAQIIVAKNRAGRTGAINMRFAGATYTFQESAVERP